MVQSQSLPGATLHTSTYVLKRGRRPKSTSPVQQQQMIVYSYHNLSSASRSIIRSKDEPSIEIIYQPWTTKTSIMMSLRLVGFKLLSEQGVYSPGHCDLDL